MITSTSNKPHWQDRHRHISHGRMIWYGDPGNDQYWYQYWKARLTSDYYISAEANDLNSDQLGTVMLQVMSPRGLHLEAGCGAGYWVAALQHSGFVIEGIEYARDLVDLVHFTNPELPVREGNALHIDRPDNHYDTYLSIGVVEHRFEGPNLFFPKRIAYSNPEERYSFQCLSLDQRANSKATSQCTNAIHLTCLFFSTDLPAKNLQTISKKLDFL
jgi:hypothetical protein